MWPRRIAPPLIFPGPVVVDLQVISGLTVAKIPDLILPTTNWETKDHDFIVTEVLIESIAPVWHYTHRVVVADIHINCVRGIGTYLYGDHSWLLVVVPIVIVMVHILIAPNDRNCQR